MDGNGRWAMKQGLGRPWGHRRGAGGVEAILEACIEHGISHLTLYAFSTENWSRPAREIRLLMRLLVSQLRSMEKKLIRSRIALVAQGTLERLPLNVQSELERVRKNTAFENPALTLCLSLSYGGRQEILDAVKHLAKQVREGALEPEAITEQHLSGALYRPDFPEPDLLIRTGGEFRVSNFLLWQIAYTELYITDTLWPDFGPSDLREALMEYSHRERRFGKVSSQLEASTEAHL
jgi:undecaprenyl diphosphate synthase